jgi:hypothetical protein
MIKSHQRLLGMVTLTSEYSAKVVQTNVAEFSSDFVIPSAEELDVGWWTKVHNQLIHEERLLDALNSLQCQCLREAPANLTRNCGKHVSNKDFCCLSAFFIQHHLVPLITASCDQLPLPSLVSHIELKVIVPELLAYIQKCIGEFDDNCSSFLSNIRQMSLVYDKSRQRLNTLIAEAAEGHLALCTADTWSLLADDFEKCELLVDQSLLLLDFFCHYGIPIHSEHLRRFKQNAAAGSKAAMNCRSFIAKLSDNQVGNAAVSSPFLHFH